MRICPSILTSSEEEFSDLVKSLKGIKYAQVDVNDGSFMGEEYKTVALSELGKIKTYTKFEAHLMVASPVSYLEEAKKLNLSRVIAQVELMEDMEDFIKTGTNLSLPLGFAYDLNSEITENDINFFDYLDAVLVMCHRAGKGGEPFSESALFKIRKLYDIREERKLKFSIVADGAIWTDTIVKVYRAGADEAVVGRRLFKGNLGDNINMLDKLAHE